MSGSSTDRQTALVGVQDENLLTQRWRTLQHITASPSRIGDIARAALVLTHFEHGYTTSIRRDQLTACAP